MSGSDKKVGVVGLTLFDLRRRGKVGKLSMVGEHLHKNITQVYNSLSTSFTSFPSDTTARDPDAYKAAIDALAPGSAITIFTPDPTHYPIAKYAIERGHHVMITKPATQLLSHHLDLLSLARAKGVVVYVEHHKRFDPAYADARHRARNTAKLGDFNYFYSYMSQPKAQLETFKAWAGKDSDISYYLNSHHIDVCESMVGQDWVPHSVTAAGSKGIAIALGCDERTEDTITLLVQWRKARPTTLWEESQRATGVYTASWTAPQKAGLHSQQYFHYVASKGEIRVDQAKRGYEVTEDPSEIDRGGLAWYNPFYMKYAPDERGDFAGQGGYGYVSFEKFVDAVQEVREGTATVADIDARGLPTLANTIATAAMLEAGRRSLDEGGRSVEIVRSGENGWELR
ncbi:hypothetical protein FH972_022729 [Carpinus fangiana]|uniref:Gfo/Idh/MocA-like oxidoreductase N-terminal domain-containing protein n=1 Tax=Carpinus fangiana TaxID=176857 RepID=A0A5N6KTR7_9ROSI|nr:hypothetical protein FH972_022729 [Carpinus fangiana]